jgi:hypothetical protein
MFPYQKVKTPTSASAAWTSRHPAAADPGRWWKVQRYRPTTSSERTASRPSLPSICSAPIKHVLANSMRTTLSLPLKFDQIVGIPSLRHSRLGSRTGYLQYRNQTIQSLCWVLLQAAPESLSTCKTWAPKAKHSRTHATLPLELQAPPPLRSYDGYILIDGPGASTGLDATSLVVLDAYIQRVGVLKPSSSCLSNLFFADC